MQGLLLSLPVRNDLSLSAPRPVAGFDFLSSRVTEKTLLTPSIAASGPLPSAIEVREAVPADTGADARIMYAAFRRFHESRGFAPDVPDLEMATGIAAGQIEDPASYGVVAVSGGRIVGSNFLTEGDPIRGVGPISVDPDFQDAGVGRLLMQAVLKRGAKARGVRLLQNAFNTKSMALYASLGFRVREPLVVITGRPRDGLPAGTQVRPMTSADLIAADSLARRVHGYARGAEPRAGSAAARRSYSYAAAGSWPT